MSRLESAQPSDYVGNGARPRGSDALSHTETAPLADPVTTSARATDDLTKAPDAEVAEAEPAPRGLVSLEQEYVRPNASVAQRSAIIQEIATMDTAQAIDVLTRMFHRERREELRLEIVSAIGAMPNEQLVPSKLAFFSRATGPATPRLIRQIAIVALGELEDIRAETLLHRLQSDSDPEIRATVTQALRGR
jgi:HEAT repeat protein